MTEMKMMKSIDGESSLSNESNDTIVHLPPHHYHAIDSILSSSINSSNNVMSTSLMSSASFTSSTSQMAAAASTFGGDSRHSNNNLSITYNVHGGATSGSSIVGAIAGASSPARFPKLEECAHFHYERVQLGRIHIRLVDENNRNDCNSSLMNETASSSTVRTMGGDWFIMKVSAGRSDPFLIRRSFENLKLFDSILHRCVYDRRVSDLRDLFELEVRDDEQLEDAVSEYLARFSLIASDTITCGSILTWLQLDNKGRRLPVADRDTMLTINTPAVGAAYGVRRYVAQACDEINIEVGDMISVIDMPSPAESIWWRGKKSLLQKNQYEVGFFPQNCVATIGDKVPRNMPLPAPLVGQLALSPTKPVLRKHGKLISFFRSFILARPSRRRLKQSGIYKERVFSCDLSEHLMNSQQDIPMVLKHCADFIENYGIVDGIYRLSGITSNIQKLRRAFDEERVPDLSTQEFRHDIHAVSSLLKMYFRELPNPLCTYQLYDQFVEAIQAKVDNNDQKVFLIKKVVQKLPPPHYRTLKYLAMHLYKISRYGESTGMTERNIAIVWAPNLLRSPALEAGGVAALKGVGVQAVVTEYLISKCEEIFDDSYVPQDTTSICNDSQPDSLISLPSLIETRDHDLIMPLERPKSLNVGAKLITLEEAQIKQNRISLESKALPINPTGLPTGCTSYIEVGGGPASLPDKYHTILPLPKNKRKNGNSLMALFRPGKSSSTHNMPSSVPLSTTPENSVTKIIPKLSTTRPITLQKPTTVSSPIIAVSAPQEMPSSDDMLDAKTVELLTKRSNSIDSLRTAAAHSRSVSHDSYFDLLQSPLRGIITMCPSREMSELRMNFDREEPEMSIFSESESLVSSPRVPKEANRRTTKIRIDDSQNTNNVNPSPKKQPRLNSSSNNFDRLSVHQNNAQGLSLKSPETPDESYCKKYKFEDQLSELQYIDSSTPEHSITASVANANNAIFTSVQIHEEPREVIDLDFEVRREKIDNTHKSVSEMGAFDRYSYPYYGVQTRDIGRDQVMISNERHSLPSTKMNVDDDTVLVESEQKSSLFSSFRESKPVTQIRHSYLDSTSSSTEFNRPSNDSTTRTFTDSKSKLSINTPQSDQPHSPSYSLLIASTTSSDNSSIINIETTKVPGKDGLISTNKRVEERPKTLELFETSLDPKIFDQKSETTSQSSLTPSDIGYHQLPLQHIEATSPKSTDDYEVLTGVSDLGGLEHAFSTYEFVKPCDGVSLSPIKSGGNTPVKATISITYNLKSPIRETPQPIVGHVEEDPHQDYEEILVQNNQRKNSKEKKGLLETNLDDTIVYERVKMLKSAVSELNSMVTTPTEAMDTEHEVPGTGLDITMQDSSCHDSLEHDVDNTFSMYENVKQPKPPAFYENMTYQKPSKIKNEDNDENVKESGYKEVEFKYEVPTKIEIRPRGDSGSSNFSVRQLATKFETSPIETPTAFDFTQKMKRTDTNLQSPTTPTRVKPPVVKDLSPNITRSLDENAFVREFGSGRKSSLAPVEIKGVLIENNSSRRKSGDNLKPKTLNQPKKLPGLRQNTEPEYCKQVETGLKNNNNRKDYSPTVPPKITPTTENRISLIQQNFPPSSPHLQPPPGFVDKSSDDERSVSSSNSSSLKVLGSCKLDRERIERIKEERRHQLSEKFRSESFKSESSQKIKSKSRSDIRETGKDNEKPLSESLRVKSKSRVELSGSRLSADGQEVQLRSPTNLRSDTSSHRLSDTKDKRNSNNSITTILHQQQQQHCDTNNKHNIEQQHNKRASSRDSLFIGNQRSGSGGIVSSSDLSARQNLNSSKNIDDKIYRTTDTSANQDRMSIKDVAAMFESKSQTNY